MVGLDSPRGLALGPEGGLYVTEAGLSVNSGNCVAVALGMNCYSESGSVTRLYEGVQERVATGLPSLYNTIRRDVVAGQTTSRFRGEVPLTSRSAGAALPPRVTGWTPLVR